MTTLTQESANVLRYAVDMGIIDNPIDQILGEALPDDVLAVPVTIFDDIFANPQLIQNPNQFELFEHPDARRYQEDVHAPRVNIDTESFFAVELSRFVVPDGQVGILKSLEQVLMDQFGSIYPTSNEYWGSPYFTDSDITQNRWYLTLDYYDGTLPPLFTLLSGAVIGIGQLPGYPYPELSAIEGIWYPAHCQSSNELNWIVPSQRMLRFFWVCPPTTNYTWQASGRLRGFTQSTYSNDAMSNARKNW